MTLPDRYYVNTRKAPPEVTWTHPLGPPPPPPQLYGPPAGPPPNQSYGVGAGPYDYNFLYGQHLPNFASIHDYVGASVGASLILLLPFRSSTWGSSIRPNVQNEWGPCWQLWLSWSRACIWLSCTLSRTSACPCPECQPRGEGHGTNHHQCTYNNCTCIILLDSLAAPQSDSDAIALWEASFNGAPNRYHDKCCRFDTYKTTMSVKMQIPTKGTRWWRIQCQDSRR